MKSTLLKSKHSSVGNKGSTLVTVLIAAAIGIIVAYSMSTMISGMYLSENGVKYRMDADTLNEDNSKRICEPF